jgi:hypothetical protein
MSKVPEWARDPDAVLKRNEEIERQADQYAMGCATLVRLVLAGLVVAGIVGGLLALLR